MSSVQAWYRRPGGASDQLIGAYDGDYIKAHSAFIRDKLATAGPHVIYRVYLEGPTFESLGVVLHEIDKVKKGEILKIIITTRDIKKAINIHSAVQYLQVEPQQTMVEGHINGYLSHQLVTPDEMVAAYTAYGNPSGRFHKTFETMLSTIAWAQLDQRIPQAQGNALKLAAIRYPALDKAISDKVVQMRPDHQRKAEQREREAQAARDAGEEGGD